MDKNETKHDPILCCLQETQFRFKDTRRLKVKDWKKCIMQTAIPQKLEWLYLHQTKYTSKQKHVTRAKE